MKINNFPTEICQLLADNNVSNNMNNILASDYAMVDNRYIPGSYNTFEVSIIVEDSNLSIFENFFKISTFPTYIPFYGNFFFSDYNINNRQDIYVFNNTYVSSHIGLNRYEITFSVSLIQ